MASETKDPGAAEKKAGSVKTIVSPKVRPSFSAVLSALGELLLEIILPALVAGGVLLWLFGGYNFWQIGRTMALVLFAIVMVVMALILAVVFDTLTTPLRNSKSMKTVGFARDPRTRLVKLVLGGLVIPLLAFGAVNMLPFPAHGTVMNYFIAAAIPPVKLTPPDEVGAIALRTKNPATRLLSIQVLKGFQSAEALEQLVRLVNEDSSVLSDPTVADTLSSAIAGYGVTARDPLVSVFKSIDPKQPGIRASANKDLFARYFAQSFESLKVEITKNTPDQAARDAELAQVQAAMTKLKSDLASMDYTALKTGDGDPRLEFILQTFLAMDLKQDADLLAFARATAADERYSNSVRGSALLLVGKIGEQKDLDLLYANLKSSDELLLNRTLQAISALQTRLAAGGGK